MHAPPKLFADKFSADFRKGGMEFVDSSVGDMVAYKIEIEHITGKHDW